MADENTEHEETTETTERPAGWDRVDYTVLPEAQRGVVEARINRLYGQAKHYETLSGELVEANKAVLDRVKALEGRETADRAVEIKRGIREAAENDDYEAIATLTEEMATLKSREAAQSAGPEKTTGPEKKLAPDDDPGTEPEDKTPDLGEYMTAENEAMLRSWATETDESGHPKRPWLAPENPKHRRATATMEGLVNDPAFANDPKALMAEMDNIMATPKPPKPPETRGAASTVLSSSPSPPRGNGKQALTAEQQAAGRALGVSDDDYRKYYTRMNDSKADGDNRFTIEFEG